jgi:transposase-like protein
MTERRRYTKRQKVAAVTAALASSVTAAAEQQGIPRKTVAYWLDSEEFADLRQKTREDLAAEMQMLAHLAASKLANAIVNGQVEPRDLIVALGVTTDKSQLLAGHATERVESKDLTDVFDDHEKRAIVQGAIRYLEGDGPREGEEVGEDAAVEAGGA